VFCYRDIPEVLRERAGVTRNITVLGGAESIVGGRSRKWQRTGDYHGIWEAGQFLLGDFGRFAKHLEVEAAPGA
jgi:hypothetical protein